MQEETEAGMRQFKELLRSELGAAWRWVDGCFVAESPAAAPVRRVEICLRSDDDVDVCFFLEGVFGSPFEASFVRCDTPVEIAAKEIANFVDQILTERLVLVDMKWFGGRRFLSPEELDRTRRVKFVASWSGTYDRNL